MSDQSGSAFGINTISESDPGMEVFADAPVEAPAEPTTPEPVQPESQPAPPAPDEQTQPGVTSDAAPAEPATQEPQRFAGRFASIEDLETGYRQLQSHQTRTYEQNRQLLERNAQLEDGIRQALPYIQQMQTQQPPAATTAAEPIRLDFDDPEKLPAAINQLVNQQVQEKLGAYQQTMAQQMLQQQEEATQKAAYQSWAQTVSRNIESFRGKHPEVSEGSEPDVQIEQVVRRLRLDPSDPEQLEIAYEAWNNPLIARNLGANPAWATSPEGREMARTWGVQPAPSANGGAASPGATSAAARTRPVAHVETGGTGAPVAAAPGARPGKGDEFDDVLELWNQTVQNPNAFYRR